MIIQLEGYDKIKYFNWGSLYKEGESHYITEAEETLVREEICLAAFFVYYMWDQILSYIKDCITSYIKEWEEVGKKPFNNVPYPVLIC